MSNLLRKVGNYYTAKLEKFGPTPQGVDWNGEEGQLLRFEQLMRVLPEEGIFSVCDVGCGYGELARVLAGSHPGASYLGIDVSVEMIASARERQPGVEFGVAHEIPRPVDFAVASGIFSVRMDVNQEEWSRHIDRTLEMMDAATQRGFAFNCLTSYSDADRMRPDLHYADPGAMFDQCKRHFSKRVALLHDYPLYEFTILVRK